MIEHMWGGMIELVTVAYSQVFGAGSNGTST